MTDQSIEVTARLSAKNHTYAKKFLGREPSSQREADITCQRILDIAKEMNSDAQYMFDLLNVLSRTTTMPEHVEPSLTAPTVRATHLKSNSKQPETESTSVHPKTNSNFLYSDYDGGVVDLVGAGKQKVDEPGLRLGEGPDEAKEEDGDVDGDGEECDEVAGKGKAPAKPEAVGELAKKKRHKGERTGDRPSKRQKKRAKLNAAKELAAATPENEEAQQALERLETQAARRREADRNRRPAQKERKRERKVAAAAESAAVAAELAAARELLKQHEK